MKYLLLVPVFAMTAVISACSDMPKECEESWKHMEKIAKQSGIPEDALKEQKNAFEEQIKSLPKDEAIQTCKAQSSILSMVK